MSNSNDYTVAWICAVSTERVAAEAFLDESDHELPSSRSPHDNNSYKLGKIGGHMVVIAVLPDGEYGTSSAACVARDLLHTFPNVRIGLMVGIGGGAPSNKHDIRLGDVVVGATRGGKSGVLQYDFGKAIQNQPLEMTGPMNQAPNILRTAIAGLRARHEIDGHNIQEAVEQALAKKPRLRKKYKLPGHENDRLYQSHIIHKHDSCPEHCGDDEAVLVARPPRGDEDDDPTIHYGVIASADKLMKNATIRDSLARDHDVLCFEMEAAGLMNHFPCLIIRGICDYSDTHKNDQWQGYAAMMAAAYAKELLLQIVPSSISNERKIADILSELGKSVNHVVEELKPVSKLVHSKHERDIMEWLTGHDYAISHKDIFTKAEPGTGQWFIYSQAFEIWLHYGNRNLLSLGNPGAGKTVITSIVINHLLSEFGQTPDVGIAYVYCNYQRHTQQRATDILSSLLRQLAQARSPLPKGVQDLYRRHVKFQTYPTLEQISEALVSVAREYSKVYIVIDALDECNASNNNRATVLREILHLQNHATANIFATSRPNMEISSFFHGSLTQDITATDGDIGKYLNRQMLLNESLIIDDELRVEVCNKVVAAADGMFLLACLQIGTLLSQPTKGDLLDVLGTFSKGEQGLDEHYYQAMQRIQDQEPKRKALAMKILTWIVHSKWPLTLPELKHALAVRENSNELDKNYIPRSEIILSLCAGLVIVDEVSTVVRLVHYTTQEFFERQQKRWFEDAETDMTITCVTYLLSKFFSEKLGCQEIFLDWPLYHYALYNWGSHVLEASARASNLLLRFAESGIEVPINDPVGLYPAFHEPCVAGLHLAAYFDMWQVSTYLIDSGFCADGHDAYGRTPLSYAADGGREAIVNLLLATGDVDPNSSPKRSALRGMTPLMFASMNGHEAVVNLLLKVHNIDIDAQDHKGNTALCHAVKSGNMPTIAALLAKDADMEISNNDGQTVLAVAVGQGNMTRVAFLLTNGANPNPTPIRGICGTPISTAAGRGDTGIVKLLLDKGANPYSRGKFDQDELPLYLAVTRGYAEVVKVLIQENVALENVPDASRTPFSFAAGAGNMIIAKLLLDTGKVDPDSKSSEGRTPLSYASGFGCEAIVELLLDTPGVDSESKDSKGRTPLSHAAANGHEAIVELLLRTHGVDPDSRAEGTAGMTPLGFAGCNGQLPIIKILLSDDRVDPDSRLSQGGKEGPTELFRAAWRGQEAIVRSLLDTNRVDVNLKHTNGWTPLDYARNKGIRHMLRENGAKRGSDL